MRAYPFYIIYIVIPMKNNILKYNKKCELNEVLIESQTSIYDINDIINNSPYELTMLNKVKENGEQEWFNRNIDFNIEELII